MPVPVGRGAVQALMTEGALLVEVLEPVEFASAHLPGAVNVPAARVTPMRVAAFDRARPTIVYGRDLQCDLSPRVARLLEGFGFTAVHDYEGGKADWLAYGLPYEGDGTVRALDLLQSCLCTPGDEPAGALRARMDSEGFGRAVVVDHGDIVLGSVSRLALEDAPTDSPVQAHMVPSPVTYRPTTTAAELRHQLDHRGVPEALVTTASGRLLGRVTRARLHGHRHAPEQALGSGRVLARAGAARGA